MNSSVLSLSLAVIVTPFDCCLFVLEASPRLRLMIGREQQKELALLKGRLTYLYYMITKNPIPVHSQHHCSIRKFLETQRHGVLHLWINVNFKLTYNGVVCIMRV